MERASAEHISRGGHVAGILVGRFEMCEWTGGLLQGPATEFMLPSGLQETLGGSTSELPIRLAFAPNSIFIQAGDRQGSQTQNRTMIMDVKAACAKGALHYQQASFQADGKLNMACAGVHHFQQLEDGSSEDFTVDVLCALFVRDGERNAQRAGLVNALAIEESSERVAHILHGPGSAASSMSITTTSQGW